MLIVNNISKTFGEKKAVSDLSFQIKPGEMLGLLGHNGAGKTTTFRMILGIISPTTGTVTYNGQIINSKNSSNVGFLTEERSLLQKYTIMDQLSYFARLKNMKKEDIDVAVDMWLKRFDLSDFKHKKIKELSKGNQQKIQFISALIHQPDLIILDEPFSGLDPFNIKLFKDVILEQKARGSAIIFSSHRLDYVQSFCEDILVLSAGCPVINGKIDDIRKDAKKYNIKISGDVTLEKLQNIAFIDSVEVTNTHFLVSVDSYDKVSLVFNELKDAKFIDMFYVDLPTLEEIIIARIEGDRNE